MTFEELVERLHGLESILRNGLPDDDRAKANVIAHAHAEVELLLECIDEWVGDDD